MLHTTDSGILALFKCDGCRYKGARDRSPALMYNFAFKIKDIVTIYGSRAAQSNR